ncbi:FecCD family ABC transporter permease [Halanaerobium saccharolyticum]|uniref:FecCD family ABC transporter permease n=1 Tax=Halanaerobium saccharolyticum TaxID=43595 RepID=UPI001FB9762C|nr:iron ABC transporter permease [Halanaerobium saccharolyticum]
MITKKRNDQIKFKKKLIKEKKVLFAGIFILTVLLLISMILSLLFGPVDITVFETFRVIYHNIFKLFIKSNISLSSGISNDIIWGIRFPRVIMAAVIGMGLSVIGVVMQAMVKNPLANPYTLGVSSGASLGATFAIMIGVGSVFGPHFIGLSAFLGALISSLVVYSIANIGAKSSSIKLLLSGMAVSALCSAFSSFIIFIANDAQGMRTLTFWLMGSLVSATWDNILLPAVILIAGGLYFLSQFRNLNMMLLGDESAITLGSDLNFYRKIYIVITALMTGMVVYVAGTIGFVGLIIPHIVRAVVGTDHKKLIVFSGLTGAIFLIWTDVLARSLLQGTEMPIGIITSLLGAPFFIWILIRKTYGFGGN